MTSEEHVLEANRRVYDSVGSDYESYDPRRGTRHVPWIESIIKSKAGKLRSIYGSQPLVFVDAGSGSGLVSRYAAQYFDQVYAIDISPVILERSHFAYNVQKICGDCSDLGSLPNRPHMVAAFATLHHLYDPAKFISGALDALMDDGWLYTDHDISLRFAKKWKLPLSLYRKANESHTLASHQSVNVDEYLLSEYHGQEGIDFEGLQLKFKPSFSEFNLAYHWKGMVPSYAPGIVKNYLENSVKCGYYAPVGSIIARK